jgi:hypothetical protein
MTSITFLLTTAEYFKLQELLNDRSKNFYQYFDIVEAVKRGKSQLWDISLKSKLAHPVEALFTMVLSELCNTEQNFKKLN